MTIGVCVRHPYELSIPYRTRTLDMFVGGGDGGGEGGDGDGDGQPPLHHTELSDHLTCKSLQSLPVYL